MPNFITQKPCFTDLADLRESLGKAQELLVALAEGEDTAQRATDLWYALIDLQKQAEAMLTEE
jgi:hypothetical protein